ncbi:hypothetical protein D3C72_1927700 [compost metagenome]
MLGSHNTRPVRAFRLLWNGTVLGFRPLASSPSGSSPIGMPATPVFPVSLGSVPLFSAPSTVSRYTFAAFYAAICSSFARSVLYRLRRNSRSSRVCRLSPSPSLDEHSYPDFDSSVLSTASLLWREIGHGREYTVHFCSFPRQSQET